MLTREAAAERSSNAPGACCTTWGGRPSADVALACRKDKHEDEGLNASRPDASADLLTKLGQKAQAKAAPEAVVLKNACVEFISGHQWPRAGGEAEAATSL